MKQRILLRKKTVYLKSFSHKFMMIHSSAVNKTMENASAFTRSFPSKAGEIALFSALILSSVLIIAGNLLTLVLFAVTKPLRRKSLFLVMNMAFADLLLGTFSVPFYIYMLNMSISFGQQKKAFMLWYSDASMPFLRSVPIYLQPLYLVRDCTPYIGRFKYCPSKHIASPFSHFGHSLPCCL